MLRRLENLLGHPTRPSTIVTTIRDTGDSSWQELLQPEKADIWASVLFAAFSGLLIDVNIRETQAADAARALIFAQAAYFRALARYQAASASIGA